MRILLVNTYIHPKNRHGMTCMAYSIEAELVISNDIQLFSEPWDLVVIPSEYIQASYFPNAKRIVYGPQNFILPKREWFLNPSHFDSRCVYNSLSPWVKTLYEEVKEFGTFPMPFRCLPFAVDTEKFCPLPVEKTNDCFVYFKHREQSLLAPVLAELKARNLSYQVLRYGSYTEDQYLDVLRRSRFGIWIGSHESQGFAVQEALSCNVPLLVLNATSMFDEYSDENTQNYTNEKGKYAMRATSVPYWDSRCGIIVTDFSSDLTRMNASWTSFAPRDYILETLSPQVCIKRFLES